MPALGPAPRWSSFLENLTEEMEESATPTLYEDYRLAHSPSTHLLALVPWSCLAVVHARLALLQTVCRLDSPPHIARTRAVLCAHDSHSLPPIPLAKPSQVMAALRAFAVPRQRSAPACRHARRASQSAMSLLTNTTMHGCTQGSHQRPRGRHSSRPAGRGRQAFCGTIPLKGLQQLSPALPAGLSRAPRWQPRA